jgi:ribosomal 50S subunit-associated protein YjgA (DUF615 family)
MNPADLPEPVVGDDELREKIDIELHEIFEQPVVRKRKVETIMQLMQAHTDVAIKEALDKYKESGDAPKD